MLTAENKALLTDFGIARDMASLRQEGQARTLAATGLPVGTPEYMAPEQLRAGVVDNRSDVYALGVVLYELLTGIAPFEGPTPYEVAALVLTEPLMPPSARSPRIWPELEQVMLTALAREPDDRYPDARTFAMALRASVLHHGERAFTAPLSFARRTGAAAFGALAATDALTIPGLPTPPIASTAGEWQRQAAWQILARGGWWSSCLLLWRWSSLDCWQGAGWQCSENSRVHTWVRPARMHRQELELESTRQQPVR